MKPLPGKVLIEILTDPVMSAGGLHIARTTKETPSRGILRAIGSPPYPKNKKSLRKPFLGKIGQTCHFRKWMGKDCKYQDKKCIVVNFTDVVAVEVKKDEYLKEKFK